MVFKRRSGNMLLQVDYLKTFINKLNSSKENESINDDYLIATGFFDEKTCYNG